MGGSAGYVLARSIEIRECCKELEPSPESRARWAASIVVGLILCAGPLWLWGVPAPLVLPQVG